MEFSILASGSKGNSTYFKINNKHILIDLGTTTKYVKDKLEELDIKLKDISSLFITHTHSDHVAGVKTYLKKHDPIVFLTESMKEDLKDIVDENNTYIIEDNIILDEIEINIIKTSHDSNDSVGYIFNYNNKKVAYITDTGYINRKYYDILSNCDYYIIESNYDVKMLMEGSYPYYLKQRILSDKGHLSNEKCGKYLTKFIGDKTKGVILIHLSEENNTEEIALLTLNKYLKKNNIILDNIIVAKQKEKTELIKLD